MAYTEVVIFNASEAFRENPEISTKALKPMLEAEGTNAPAYYGLQIENKSTGYIFINWDSYESHQAFSSHPSFPETAQTFREVFTGNVQVYDVQFSGSPNASLEQPVTTILVLTLKAPENREGILEVLNMFSEVSGGMHVFGQTRQDENKYVLVGGWPSIQAHREAGSTPQFAAARTKLDALSNREHLYHSSLSQYTL